VIEIFRTARMRKFRCVFLRNRCEEVVGALHEAGVVQLREVSDLGVARMVVGDELREVSALLSRFREMEEFLRPEAGRTAVGKTGLAGTLEQAKKIERRVWPRVSALRERIRQLERESSSLDARLELVRRLEGLGADLQYLRPTERVWIAVGEIAEDNLDVFSSELSSALSGRVILQAFGSGRRRLILMACMASDREKVSPLLYRHEVELLELPEMRGPPGDALRELEGRMREIDAGRRKVEEEMRRLSGAYGRRISALRELLEIEKERLEARGLFGSTESTVVMEGWVPEKNVGLAERVVERASGGRYAFSSYEPQPGEFESVPSKFENPAGLDDFEYITRMYGMPKYEEVDPTPVLAITFPAFFAIALSDAGYGLALALFMASGVWIAGAFPVKLRRVMAISGICAAIAGVLVGGFFGLGQGIWVNPIERPVPILKLSIFIGIAHLVIGIGFTGILRDILSRRLGNILFERLPKVLLLLGVFGLSFCVLGIGLYEFGISFSFPKVGLFDAFNPLSPAPGLVGVFRLIFYSGLGLGIAGALIQGSGMRGKIGGAINSVYGVTGLIADVTSYCRLLALCIASGVIAFSINFILGFVWSGLAPSQINPITAVYVCLLAAVFGVLFFLAHSFNIFLSSLGAFVHTLRLHFAEFFSKFYEGGGEEFKPFAAKRSVTSVRGIGIGR